MCSFSISRNSQKQQRAAIEIGRIKTPYFCWSRYILMGPVPRAMAFKKEKTNTLGSGLSSKFRSC